MSRLHKMIKRLVNQTVTNMTEKEHLILIDQYSYIPLAFCKIFLRN